MFHKKESIQSKNKWLSNLTLNSTTLSPMFNLEGSNSIRVVNGSMQLEIQTNAMRPSLILANQNSTEFSDNLLTKLSKLYAEKLKFLKKLNFSLSNRVWVEKDENRKNSQLTKKHPQVWAVYRQVWDHAKTKLNHKIVKKQTPIITTKRKYQHRKKRVLSMHTMRAALFSHRPSSRR